jgi:hypothetical protein
MRILVCGSRRWTDKALVREYLKQYPGATVVHGGCRGADALAGEVAAELDMPVEVYRAHWSLGPRAGPIRNQEMVDSKPDLVVAFLLPESRGTWDCVARAKRARIPVNEVRPRSASSEIEKTRHEKEDEPRGQE